MEESLKTSMKKLVDDVDSFKGSLTAQMMALKLAYQADALANQEKAKGKDSKGLKDILPCAIKMAFYVLGIIFMTFGLIGYFK